MSMALLLLAAAAGPALRSTPDLGKAEGRCRVDERGPAFIVEVAGLKDRAGLLKLEVYPPDEDDFLAEFAKRGVRTARVINITPPTATHTLRFAQADAPTQRALTALKDKLPGEKGFGPCSSGA